MSKRLTRRAFLTRSAAAAGGVLFLPRLAAARGANEKLNIAHIGCGGRGGAHLGCGGQNIVALCDTSDGALAGAAKRFPNAKTFSDYRKLFDEVKDLDGVTVATADHSHYPASMMAIQRGIGVFTEKPLAHSVAETRRLAQAAREKKVATQMGNQGHCAEGYRLVCEWIWAGACGTIGEVHCWTDRPIWPQGQGRPAGEQPVPADLHWDEWIGPAPMRPYNRGYQPFVWRGWFDFGCGALGDMGAHIMDGAVWALKLDQADRFTVQAEHSGVNDETFPSWSIITYQFPARGEMPPVKLVWYDGKKLPPRPAGLEAGRSIGSNGTFFIGDKCGLTVGCYGGGPRLFPETAMKAFQLPAKTIPRVPGMHEDWIRAIKGGPAACSNFTDSAGPLTEIMLVGCIALRVPGKLEWDAQACKFTNSDKANQYVNPPHRKGWDV